MKLHRSTYFHITVEKKAVEEFQSYPYLSGIMRCLIWVFYADKLVGATNSMGFSMLYLMLLFVYVPHEGDRKKRLRVYYILFCEVVLMAIIIVVAVLCFHDRRALFVRVVGGVFDVIMYASPLAIWKTVVSTRSVEYMPFWLSFAVLSTSMYWTVYAIVQFDILILVPNGLGVIFGVIQLGLYAYFYFHGNNRVRPSEETIGGSAV
ncbi:hypothetical protein V6N11_070012 [Hibiscus sabdariffa]|uniref:Bidirectional sugar transporter SWEET n=1 Tax=Hibiscus sabdariffa TaxID=183260 RepID=A0ABR2QDQ0_9ROSI